MYREHTIAAVIPAYNESGFVGTVIDELPTIVDRAYVIDDGSTDDTWSEICRHAAARNEHHEGLMADLVVPIRHETNRGVGGAIKSGYLRAREEEIDITVVLGGDDQMDPTEIPAYIDPIIDDDVDYTKGNRFSRPADWEQMPRFRLLGNLILSYLTKFASGYWNTMDSQNGYTAISLDALQRTDIEGMYEYYGYCNDLLVRLNVAGIRVGDVPRSSAYAYSEGWKSHIEYWEYIPRVSGMLARSFFWRIRRKYLIQHYEPIAPLYLLGIGTVITGSLATVISLVRRRSTIGPWFLSLLTGLLVILYATIIDRTANEHLEYQVEREPTVETADISAHDHSLESTSIRQKPVVGVRSDGETDQSGSQPEQGIQS